MLLPPLPPQPVPLCVLVLAIVTASTDITCRRIPNAILGIGLAAALVVQVCLHGALAGGLTWIAGAACGLAVLLPFYLLRGMAAGDVKLLMTIGAWVGAATTIRIALLTFLIGGVWSLAVVLYRGRLLQTLANVLEIMGSSDDRRTGMDRMPLESVGALPYGVAIAAGTVGVLFASVA